MHEQRWQISIHILPGEPALAEKLPLRWMGTLMHGFHQVLYTSSGSNKQIAVPFGVSRGAEITPFTLKVQFESLLIPLNDSSIML